MEWWHEAKFGMFIHWGLYSIPGGEWKGKQGRRDAHIHPEFRIPGDEYAARAGQFDPVKFDADAWVKLAKDAGLGYIVYVSKVSPVHRSFMSNEVFNCIVICA